ncbi:MAG TPA: hypothetical protein VNY74_13110, partial [Edaphobacter sp.]|nr:hypothetical protein [Edaphobacter sp.]
MPRPTHHRITRAARRSCRLPVLASLIFFGLLTARTLQAQLPAGTTDAAQPQQKQDPLLTQANEALDK